MVTVASKELRNRLGKYLALIRKGEAVQITDRGRPIGCIFPTQDPEQRKEAELLGRLVASGNLTLGTGRLSWRLRPVVMTKGKTVAEMVAEDRR